MDSPIYVMNFEKEPLPVFAEARGDKPWVKCGSENDWPYYLIDLYQLCELHQTIIDGKVSYICGGGWSVDTSGLTVYEQAQAQQFLSQKWGESTLNELTEKVCFDDEIQSGFAILVEAPKNKKSLPTLTHLDWAHVRTNKDKTKYYYTSQWYLVDKYGNLRENPSPEDAEDFKEYAPYDFKKLGKDRKQVLVVQKYRPRKTVYDVYPIPSYIAAIRSIETDIELNLYHHSNVIDGFVGTHFVQFYNGNPSEPDKKKIEAAFTSKFGGGRHGKTSGEKGGRIVFGFYDNPDRAAKIDALQPSGMNKQYEGVDKRTEQKILIAHGVTSGMLFGIKEEGQLGGRQELAIQNELFQSRYVKPRQQRYEEIFNQLAADFGIKAKFKLKRHDPIDLDWFGNDNLFGILTPEQKLEKAGLPAQVKPVAQVQQFSAEDAEKALLAVFGQMGRPAEDFEELLSLELKSFNPLDVESSETVLMAMDFEKKLPPIQRAVLDLLGKDPLMPPEEMAKTLKVDASDIEGATSALIESGLLKRGTEKSAGDKIPAIEITESGTALLEAQPAKTANISVRYSYEVRSGMGAAVIDTTRDFCREMIKLNRLYTREEIEAISALEDRNVWEMRGGWYTKPGTDVHVPSCRHIWKQKVVREKQA